ncbi:nitroreductase family protein [Mangrovibacterium sp.]|uniref:nitroreductase family protein n=1 Tax=Mangrovibacterium sp. TaxID=1961364 RepID=UPI003569313D
MIEFIRQRRSIRKFTNQPVEAEKLTLLQEAVLRSPASKNANAWEFLFVQNKETIRAMAGAKPFGSKFLENAPLAVVVMADDSKTEAWIEDCSVASTILMLAAQSIGLGNCWVQIRDRDHSENQTAESYLRELLQIPSNLKILSVIAIGYSAQNRAPKDASDLLWDKIHVEHFNLK